MLLHGEGEAFTAGNDLIDFLQKPWKGQDLPPAVRFIRAVVNAKKPIVAAVHGATVGIGTTILLHCDLVYAAENTKFLMPFINLGIVPEAGSTVLLPLLVGHQRAAELLMLGVPFNAQRAYELGLGECRGCSRGTASHCNECGAKAGGKASSSAARLQGPAEA